MSSFPKDLPETNHTFWPDPSTAAFTAAEDGGGCAEEDPDAVNLQVRLLALGFPPGEAACVAAQQVRVAAAPFGFGSVVNSWLKPYMYALAHGYAFWSPPLGLFRDRQHPLLTSTPPAGSRRSSNASESSEFESAADATVSAAPVHAERCVGRRSYPVSCRFFSEQFDDPFKRRLFRLVDVCKTPLRVGLNL